jgi:hypothetical protein
MTFAIDDDGIGRRLLTGVIDGSLESTTKQAKETRRRRKRRWRPFRASFLLSPVNYLLQSRAGRCTEKAMPFTLKITKFV